MSELEKQLAPLERQAEKAKEYLKKKETLKEVEVHIFLIEAEQIKEQLERLAETFQITEGDLRDTSKAFENTKLEYERIEKELEGIEGQIDAAKEEASAGRLKKQQMKGQIAVLKEQVRSAKASSRHYQERMDSIEKELSSFRRRKRWMSSCLRHRKYSKKQKRHCCVFSKASVTARPIWRTAKMRSLHF